MHHFTLTSDFGSQNYALASVKGKIYQTFPNARITGISNHIAPFNLQQAAYIFKQAYRHFPADTFHFIFNDLYADEKHQLVYAYENQQHIFSADNGFMTLLFDDQPVQLYLLTDRMAQYNHLSIADAFLTNVACLCNKIPGNFRPADVNSLIIKHPANASVETNHIEAQVLHIDHFGNVVLNVTRHQFEEARRGRAFRIYFMRDEEISTLSQDYSSVPQGQKLCFFNTANYLEIAVNKGNAATLFGFQMRHERSLFYNNIKIFFE